MSGPSGGGGERPEAVPDLLNVLKWSLRRKGGGKDGGRSETSSLDELTKDELYARAKERDLPGRSSMTKDELVEALQGSERS